MDKSGESGDSNTSRELLRQMTAGSQDAVEREIRFTNDDVPEYLENVRQFHEESRKTSIPVD